MLQMQVDATMLTCAYTIFLCVINWAIRLRVSQGKLPINPNILDENMIDKWSEQLLRSALNFTEMRELSRRF